MSRRFLSRKWSQVLIHVLIWTILIIVPFYLSGRYGDNRRFFRLFFIKDIITYGILFYVNYLILVPLLFFKGKRLNYFIAVLALIVGFYFISFLPNAYIVKRPDRAKNVEPRIERPDESRAAAFRMQHAYNYTLASLVIAFLSLGLGSLNRQTQIERKQEQLEKEKLNSELAFLKNQISPHFFFNTLNNIYSLIEINTENAREAIIKLSKLMRYLLYESEQGETQLGKEIDFMNHFIDLMKLRLSNKVDLKVHFPSTDEKLAIPPLLFIPFIENAFKHGISNREKSLIDISMELHQNILTFQCKNTMVKGNNDSVDLSGSGIGLENSIKRLNLLFPDTHTLKISQIDDLFHVFLEIRFQKTAMND
jgi:two-component system LytT family sensor kinase